MAKLKENTFPYSDGVIAPHTDGTLNDGDATPTLCTPIGTTSTPQSEYKMRGTHQPEYVGDTSMVFAGLAQHAQIAGDS